MDYLSLFTHPETFRRIRLQFLHAWLWPWRGYLAERRFIVPDTAADWVPDYEQLAAVFMEPDAAMPRPLMRSTSLIHEMSTEPAMSDLTDLATRLGLDLNLGDDPDPVDVAVQVWLRDPRLLEEAHNLHQLDRPRGFVHFIAARPPEPGFDGPTDAQKSALEVELAEWFFNAKRGRHARVWTYRRPGEYWFLVRHGLASRRQEVVSATGTDTLIFRPGEYDVLVYNRQKGELRVHGCSPREVDMLRRAFGKHLFNDTEFFPGGAKFTLAPLVESGRACLACQDIPGVEDVTLTEVQTLTGGREWLRVTHQAGDLFTAIEQERVWLPEPDCLVRASFLIRFSDSKKRRTIKIMGSNRLSVVRDGDTVLMEKWLDARGFIVKRTTDEQVPDGILASA